MPDRLYIVDTDSWVGAWRDMYTPATFPFVWEWIDDHIAQELLISHSEVLKEVKWPEELKEWLDDRAQIFSNPDAEEMKMVGELQAKYPEFLPKGGATVWADPWLVVRARESGAVLVTQEKGDQSPKKLPYVAKQEGLTVISVEQMVNILGAGK